MICLPVDDLCHIQQAYEQIVIEQKIEASQPPFATIDAMDGRTFMLSIKDGNFIMSVLDSRGDSFLSDGMYYFYHNH